MQSTNYVQTETIVRALEFALNKGGFGANGKQRKTAQSLIKAMKSNDSVSGRHQQLATMLKKGATIEQMMRAAGASRRTVFRYLNHFEDSGVNIEIEDGKYRMK